MKRKKLLNVIKYNYIDSVVSKKEMITKGFHTLEGKKLQQKTSKDSKIFDKILLFTMACVVLGVLTSGLSVHVLNAFMCLCGLGVAGLSVLTVKLIADLVITKVKANKGYEQVEQDCLDICDNLVKDITPMLSPYLLESTKEREGNKTVFVESDLIGEKTGDEVVSALVDNKTILVSDIDEYLETVLKIDAVIFAAQYEGYEQDIIRLQSLVQKYMTRNWEYSENYGLDDTYFYQELGKLYSEVMLKKEEHEHMLTEPEYTRVRRIEDDLKRD